MRVAAAGGAIGSGTGRGDAGFGTIAAAAACPGALEGPVCFVADKDDGCQDAQYNDKGVHVHGRPLGLGLVLGAFFVRYSLVE